MAIAYVTKGSGSTSGYAASPLTISSVACGTASDTIVIGWLKGFSGSANTIANMSVNGDTSGTTAHAEQDWAGGNNSARLFYWRGTGPGTVSVAFSWTGDISGTSAGVIVYSGVSDLANIGAAIGGSTTTALSRTVTSATGDLAFAVWLCDSTAATFTAGSGGTERFDETIGSFTHFASEEAGAASVTVDGTTTSSVQRNVTYGFSLTAAAGGGGSTQPPRSMHTYQLRRRA